MTKPIISALEKMTILAILTLCYFGYAIADEAPNQTLGQQPYEEGIKALKAKNIVAAAPFFQLAAKEGNRAGQYQLGLLYARGAGVPQDFAKAHQLFEKSAMQGYPKSFYQLGEMFVYGDGVEVNYAEALAWFWIGTSMGDPYAKRRLRAMNTRISNKELSDAKARSNELWAKIPHDLKNNKAFMNH
ncbi:MAG: tetratricopeptide repeat protein [Mariprofundaceae bacterium]